MANTSKPISLHPLKLKDVVKALLKVEPEPKQHKKPKNVQKIDRTAKQKTPLEGHE
jgi:hypothetical protein